MKQLKAMTLYKATLITTKDVIPAKAGIQGNTALPRVKYPMSSTGRAKSGLVNPGITEYTRLVPSCIVVGLLLFGMQALAAESNLPVMKGKKVVATVDGEPITLDEFNQELASLDSEARADKKNQSDLLRRLINTRLILQEARRTGLDELAEIKKRVEVFSRITLREELMERHIKNLKPDEKEVERLYREYVKEWKISSALFEKEDVAKEMEEAVRTGKDFEEQLRRFVAGGRTKESELGKYFKGRELAPEIRAAIEKMKIGEVGPVIRLKAGFVIFRLEDVRFPENEQGMALARAEALRRKQSDALQAYIEALKKKYVKVNQKVLDSINYDVDGPGFQKLLKDQRILAEIAGEKPITVGELTDALRQQLYHGVERALEGKRLNKRKSSTFDEMIHKRVLQKEALRLSIDKTESYQRKVREHEDSYVFGAYIKKAVAPDIKLKDAELEAYYKEHVKEFTYPEMIRINSLAFLKKEDAESAIEKLRKGTDFQWLKAHAEGQVERTAQGLLEFEGKPVLTKELPDDMQKVLSGARAGDFKLYGSSGGHFYVLAVQEVVSSKPKPFDEVRQEIAMKVFDEKLKKAVEDLADKLRALSEVKIFLKT
jgi:parvulin-like peptidyl-prolyl isomerase